MTKRVQISKRESNVGNIVLNVIKRIRLGTYYSLQSHQLCKTRDSIRIFKKKKKPPQGTRKIITIIPRVHIFRQFVRKKLGTVFNVT